MKPKYSEKRKARLKPGLSGRVCLFVIHVDIPVDQETLPKANNLDTCRGKREGRKRKVQISRLPVNRKNTTTPQNKRKSNTKQKSKFRRHHGSPNEEERIT